MNRSGWRLVWGLAVLAAWTPAAAQTPADALGAPAADTAVVDTAAVGTAAVDTAVVGTAVVALAAATPADTLAADSVRTPRHALRRSLAVPGWGQLYTGHRVRAAVAAGAVAGALVYAAVRQRRYERYRRAALVAGCQASPDRPVCDGADRYTGTWTDLGSPAFAAVAPVRDRARGQRDVAVLLAGVVYAVQALDALVQAELADFDVSESLSVRVAPGGGALVAARLRW